MKGSLLAADQVPRDREQTHGRRVVLADAHEADVGTAGTARRLDGVADDRALAHRAVAAIEQDVRGGRRLGVEVVLDVIAANLEITDLAINDADSSLLAVADMIAVDVGLMQVDAVEKDAHT